MEKKTRKMLLLAMALAALAASLFFGFAWRQEDAIDGQEQKLAQLRLPNTHLALKLGELLERSGKRQALALLAPSEAATSEQLAKLAEDRKRRFEMEQELDGKLYLDEARAAFLESKPLMRSVDSLEELFVELVSSGRKDEALSLLTGQLAPALDRYVFQAEKLESILLVATQEDMGKMRLSASRSAAAAIAAVFALLGAILWHGWSTLKSGRLVGLAKGDPRLGALSGSQVHGASIILGEGGRSPWKARRAFFCYSFAVFKMRVLLKGSDFFEWLGSYPGTKTPSDSLMGKASFKAIRGYAMALSLASKCKIELWQAQSGFPLAGFSEVPMPLEAIPSALSQAPWGDLSMAGELTWLCREAVKPHAGGDYALTALAEAVKAVPPEWASTMREQMLALDPDLPFRVREHKSLDPALAAIESEMDEQQERERAIVVSMSEGKELAEYLAPSAQEQCSEAMLPESERRKSDRRKGRL